MAILSGLLNQAVKSENSQAAAVKILDDLNSAFRADATLQKKVYLKKELARIAEQFISMVESDSGIDMEEVRASTTERLEGMQNDHPD